MPVPLPKAAELTERVAELGRAPVVNELALRRIAADAKRIASTDGANARAVLGRVAALQWNIVEMKRQYELAISMNDSATSRRDYAMSLFLVGEAGSAYEMALDAWRRAPSNPAVIEQLVVAAVHDARFRQAKTFCDRWSKLVPAKKPPLGEVVEELATAVDENVFSEDGARDVLRTADAIRCDARIRPNGVAVVPSVEEPGSFLYQYRLIASPAVAADLNETLALRWAESRKCMADPGLKFLPMFIGTVADRTLVRSGTLDRFARHQLPAVEDQRQADVPH